MLIGLRGIWRRDVIHILSFHKITFRKLLVSVDDIIQQEWQTLDSVTEFRTCTNGEPNDIHSSLSSNIKAPIHFFSFFLSLRILLISKYLKCFVRRFSFLHVFFITCTCFFLFSSHSEDWNFIFLSLNVSILIQLPYCIKTQWIPVKT
jgi:hypothetical protein